MGQPTMDDVASLAGVSRALVSLVMRESPRASAASREKVLAAAAELGYRPNILARNLATGRTNTIGLMLNDLHNPFFTEVAEGAAVAASDAGLQILINSGWQRHAGELAAIESLMSLRTDGLLLVSPRIAPEVLDDFAARNSIVIVSAFDHSDEFDTINNHEVHGATQVVDHLLDLGHQRIAHIDAGHGAGGPQRRSAFMDAMLERSLAPIVVEGDYNEEAGFRAARQLMALHEPPTAIFACNDLAAVGVLSLLQELGVSVPEEVSVIGYDDTLLARLGPISLTTVHQPRQEVGKLAVANLLERIAGRTEAKHELIEPRLITRSSTGRAPNV